MSRILITFVIKRVSLINLFCLFAGRPKQNNFLFSSTPIESGKKYQIFLHYILIRSINDNEVKDKKKR